MTRDVIVIGGGVSGLSTAHNLMKRGFDVTVLERQVVTGGNAISERFDGFLMEHGPTTFNASLSEAVAQITTLGLLESAKDLGPEVKKRYLRDQGHLTGISTGPAGFILSNYLSPMARLRILTEGLRPRRKDGGEETIHGFASRRFGLEFADKVIDPLAAGLFMGDASQLSITGAFARLAAMEIEHGSITKAILKAKKGSEPGRHLYSWRGGIASIPQALTQALGTRVQTGVAVRKLRRTQHGFEVETSGGTLRARAIIMAVQPHVAAGLIENIDPDGATAAGAITAPPVNVVFLGYRRGQVAHPLDGLGFLSTKDPSCTLSGAQFLSTMYEGRAPDGHVAISAYAGGVRNPQAADLSERELIQIAHGELSDLLGIKGEPVVARTRRWALGLPQYTLGHTARVEILKAACERLPGLYLTGNFIDGVSVANCMSSAGEVAAKVAQDLRPEMCQAKTG